MAIFRFTVLLLSLILTQCLTAAKLKAPDIAENGAVVPITVRAVIKSNDVLEIVTEKGCVAARVTAYKTSGIDSVAMRVKMAQSGNIIARLNGEVIAQKFIKVSVGGYPDSYDCKSYDVARSQVRDIPHAQNSHAIRMRVNSRGKLGSVKSLISHPMSTGDQVNKETGQKMSAYYITYLELSSSNNKIGVEWSPLISRNPYLSVEMGNFEKGDLVTLKMIDSKDVKHTKTIEAR